MCNRFYSSVLFQEYVHSMVCHSVFILSPCPQRLKEQRAQVNEFSNSPQQNRGLSGTPLPPKKCWPLPKRMNEKRKLSGRIRVHICMQFTSGKECRGTPKTKFRLRRGLLLLWGDMTNRNTFWVILDICLNQPCYIWIQEYIFTGGVCVLRFLCRKPEC